MSSIRPFTAIGRNIQPTLHTAPDLSKSVSIAELSGRKGNPYTVSTHLVMFIYTHILHNVEMLGRQKKYTEMGHQ